MSKFEFQRLQSLLGRRSDDKEVVDLLGRDLLNIERSAHVGFLEYKSNGVSVMFEEAPWILPESQVTDPRALHLSAFHLHRKNHEGYLQYQEQLPGGVILGDSKTDVIRKLGRPGATGGGGVSLLNRPIPYWLKYSLSNAVLHFQLDKDEKVEMLTLQLPDHATVEGKRGD
jgi:hypothetical protein